VIPREGDKLGAACASAFVAVLFTVDAFPTLLAHMKEGSVLEGCGQLLNVSSRPRVNAWYTRERIKDVPWTVSRYGTSSWIKGAAEKAGKDDENIFAAYL
jgi:hypothetical protein